MALSPTLSLPIALAYLTTEPGVIGAEVMLGEGEKAVKMNISPIPFYDPEGIKLRA
jgi:glycine cleavage system aminomethyltransferase T